MEKLGARVVRTDSEWQGFEGRNLLDGDPGTLWHTPWTGRVPGYPHEVIIEFDRPSMIKGLTALPRQDGKVVGMIKSYAAYAGSDGTHWGEPVVQGSFEPGSSLKTIVFPKSVEAKYIRLVAISGQTDGPWTSLAELEVLE